MLLFFVSLAAVLAIAAIDLASTRLLRQAGNCRPAANRNDDSRMRPDAIGPTWANSVAKRSSSLPCPAQPARTDESVETQSPDAEAQDRQ